MIKCANCLHCKVKVDIFGDDKSEFKWARYAVCEKGRAVDGNGINKSIRLLSNVRKMVMEKCEFYEPMGEGTFGMTKYKSSISFDGLNWYYKHIDLNKMNKTINVRKRHGPKKGKMAPADYRILS